jgi:precorrin-2/cobalt-factor-2 C20-methyltransferase
MGDRSSIPSDLGQLIGIGVGPGDPELITVKALRALEAAPVVAFPARPAGKPGVAQQIITPWLRSHQQPLPLEFPFVQDEAVLQAAWVQAAATVWPYLERGQDVVFATEGDVSFYSTFTYLAQTLQHQHPAVMIQAIPGVCSPLAAAAVLGLPLTVQAERLLVLPALYTVADLTAAIAVADVIVLMKVGSVYSQVWQVLAQHQLLEQSYVVTHATRPDQRIYRDLTVYPELQLPYFSLLVVQVKSHSLS